MNEYHPYIGKNAAYYEQKWKQHSHPARFAGWNWAAFLLGPVWAASRHLYVLAAGYFLLYLTFLLLESLLPALLDLGAGASATPVFLAAPILFLHVAFGLAANAVYWRKVKKMAQLERAGKPSPPLFRGRGQSKKAGAVVSAGMLLLAAAPALFLFSWAWNPPLDPGIYVYDGDQPPSGELDTVENPVFYKYESMIQLYYIGEALDGRELRYELHYLGLGAEERIAGQAYPFFSGSTLSLNLLNAEDPELPEGEYRVDVYLDDELFDMQSFVVTVP
ncbi:DUF2628 domain-containing protein [Bacillus daqingensis]|uniref:DUF2628 domain-containing protein n=1 Tax=Bacillus daqingensis TaxID=872396 RepID=A0ABV9NTH4_9BACI